MCRLRFHGCLVMLNSLVVPLSLPRVVMGKSLHLVFLHRLRHCFRSLCHCKIFEASQ